MAPGPVDAPVKSWADDGEDEAITLPEIQTTVGPDGVTTVVEYKINEDGKKVKVTRRIKRTLVKTQVNHAVAERKAWPKFGKEKGAKPGPHAATTTITEAIRIKLQPGGLKPPVDDEEERIAAQKAQLAQKRITCRLCQGEHFTSRCPYKDTLGGLPGVGGDGEDDTGVADEGPGSTSKDGKYIPPSMRAGAANRVGESMNGPRNRDDMPTLRVTNLSEDATEDDLWELFGSAVRGIGKIHRIYVGMDQETGLCKGFAFVSFEERSTAEKAMAKINGLPYAHLILSCAFSVPRENRDTERR
ncbi:uncharacterized protein L969DRAFT_100704 [Mixia osmundae IAM 14324]|uniref:Eukaryotic translation initiation factor 3 subunit G n=1 Tax=Mixia osmundae (strain CBS 9802 / IAM 14324 / JCM 22182 / KY 12970) TaxID=764103 RepID=G7E035_MIXOS|nr:uncharacterized protein L969DRAFT_100704 [Mixia osmundae IAM 14324]KEI42187.1 hypothetical protein L969DRAFT_100704 [Mixia osmundae IAM 14324]GAA96195.1 hypothetical protein E5Q_02859 [Mixia osmundae IAM 14324]